MTQLKPRVPGDEAEAVANHGRTADASSLVAAIVESSNDAILSVNSGGVVTSWNRAAEQIFGYSATEIVGRPVAVLIPEERAGEEQQLIRRVRDGELVAHHETVRCRKNGARVNVALTVSPLRNTIGEIFGAVNIVRDLTEHRQIEERTAQMRLAIEATPSGMVMIDERGTITMVNSQLERMFGYDRGEMLGRPVEMLLPGRFRVRHPRQREAFFHSPETRPMGHGRDLFARRKDGTEFPVEVGLNPAKTPDGTFVLGAVIDITARKQMEAELAKVHADLHEHARNLEATVAERTAHLRQIIAELETVSYSLSHDLRGPLRTIQGFSQIVLTDAADRLEPDEKELLAKSVNAARRLDRLIQDVLTYSRVSRQALALHSVEVEPLVRQIIDERPEFQSAELVIESPLEPVHGHEASLTQVITNLLDNAVKFMPPGGRPRIRIRTERDGDQVNLWLEDNGIGIPVEAQGRLFAIFQRVHDEKIYPGTGIGLAIVRKAVERMGGTVRVESEPGRGSRFCVRLSRGEAR